MQFTLWTIRISVACYLASMLLRIRHPRSLEANNWARTFWTLGFVMYLEHLLCAFEFVHHWNHAAAYEETARRTLKTVGVAFGGGVYVNYIFGVIWGLDVEWWWRNRAGYESRSMRVSAAIHTFLAFIMFNACVVFAPQPMLWWGLAGTGALLLALGDRWVHGVSREVRNDQETGINDSTPRADGR